MEVDRGWFPSAYLGGGGSTAVSRFHTHTTKILQKKIKKFSPRYEVMFSSNEVRVYKKELRRLLLLALSLLFI